ncbi:hypothetical protein XENORESO_003787 [Xenotaenia resolanae]|uniref:Uncharacterized protein n=1 Tax=Xenotaenia resolanae TaxID=208358 RepID=A0ABV0VMT7_9TELE
MWDAFVFSPPIGKQFIEPYFAAVTTETLLGSQPALDIYGLNLYPSFLFRTAEAPSFWTGSICGQQLSNLSKKISIRFRSKSIISMCFDLSCFIVEPHSMILPPLFFYNRFELIFCHTVFCLQAQRSRFWSSLTRAPASTCLLCFLHGLWQTLGRTLFELSYNTDAQNYVHD